MTLQSRAQPPDDPCVGLHRLASYAKSGASVAPSGALDVPTRASNAASDAPVRSSRAPATPSRASVLPSHAWDGTAKSLSRGAARVFWAENEGLHLSDARGRRGREGGGWIGGRATCRRIPASDLFRAMGLFVKVCRRIADESARRSLRPKDGLLPFAFPSPPAIFHPNRRSLCP